MNTSKKRGPLTRTSVQEVAHMSKCGSRQIALGSIMICDFKHLEPPEISKKRPVVVVAGVEKDRLLTVIPLSTTPPRVRKGYHYCMSSKSFPYPWQKRRIFAKCDILNSVSRSRLEPIMLGAFVFRCNVGDRELDALLQAVAVGLNLNRSVSPSSNISYYKAIS